MSLHAQLSPEAETRLRSQQRTSTLTSVIIALLAMVLLGVILLIIAMNTSRKEIPQLEAYIGTAQPEDQLTMKKISNTIVRTPSSPSVPMAKIIITNVPSSVSVPQNQLPGPEIDIGQGDGFGSGGWGEEGAGPGANINNIPHVLRKRCSQADRMERLLSNGGNTECEEAVVNSLRWLMEKQNKDGSWTDRKQVGMTGLALLVYLGHCETAQSEEFGETVLAAITYLVDKAMKNNGKLASDFKDDHWCYEHAIGVYALAEAYSLCVKGFAENIPGLEDAVIASGQFLINSQHTGGGWDYAYREDSDRGGDVSIVGWHLQALKACKLTGLDFKNLRKCGKKGFDYLERMQLPSGAVGYSAPQLHAGQDGTTLAAVGALCAQIWKSPATKVARKAIRFIDKEMKFEWNGPDSDLYGHYYAVQAMINHGGLEWESYNKLFRDQLLKNQNPDSSFRPVNGGKQDSIKAVAASFAGDNPFATHYRTCLATLMLESYYRFLPASQGEN